MSQFSKWMNAASWEDKNRFARRLGLSNAAYLYHLASGRRPISSVLAQKMERLSEREFPKLPPLHREKLSKACAGCDFAKRCRS